MKCTAFLVLIFLPSLFLTSKHRRHEQSASVRGCRVTFSIVNAGMEVTGVIDSVRATTSIDLDHLAQSSIVASADPSTIKTGIAIRDNHLLRSDYFNVAMYRTIQLRSTALRKTGQRSFIGTFDLTIKGVTRSVNIPFRVKRDRGKTHYSGSFVINRLDFNLGERSSILGDVVRIHIRAAV